MRCQVQCYMHGAATFAVETHQRDWLRAHLPAIERLAGTIWARRCTCNLIDRVRECIHGY